MIAIVEGEQKRIGEDIKDPIRPMVFRLDALAPPYKNMNEYKKMTSGRFKVDNMIFDNDDEDSYPNKSNYIERDFRDPSPTISVPYKILSKPSKVPYNNYSRKTTSNSKQDRVPKRNSKTVTALFLSA